MKEKDFLDLSQKKLAADVWAKITKHKEIPLKSRKREYVIHRHSFLVAMRKYPTMSLDAIGTVLGKDHATVIHACKQHEMNYKFDRDYKSVYYQIDNIVAKTMLPYSLLEEHTYDEFMERNKAVRERLMKLASQNRELINTNNRLTLENESLKKQSKQVNSEISALKTKISGIAW